MKALLLRTSTQSDQLVTKQSTRRKGVGKALEPTSSPKTSNNSKPEETPTIHLFLPFLIIQKTEFATTPI